MQNQNENSALLRKDNISENPHRLGDYEIVKHPHGFYSILHISSGEVMHSVSDPIVESMSLYFGQSGMAEALKNSAEDEFVIWDVGLGAGTNAMITVMELEKFFTAEKYVRKVKMISFENDLDSFRLAAANPLKFPHIRHPAPLFLLKNGRWISGNGQIEWLLLEGDFQKWIDKTQSPDCIYYDLYSLNTLPFAWTHDMFKKIFKQCKKTSRLMTYSASTKVRSNLLAAGFFVGYGAASGPKDDTTIAFGSLQAAHGATLLTPEWLDRWKRSGHRFDKEITEKEKEEIIASVLAHEQFKEIAI